MNTTTNSNTKALEIVPMKADQWDALMAGTEKQTPKQMVLTAFEALEAQAFIVCPVADGRTQDQYVQDVSVFLNKKGYQAAKKQVRKHPTDATKIVVRRLA